MAQPYVGEIRMFAGSFAPVGWLFCDGSLLSISQYETLFNLIGTTYGGDGLATFALPDLRSRVPIHMGQGPGLGNYVLAENGGAEQVTLTVNQIPAHTHRALAQSAQGTQSNPANGVWAASNLGQYSGNNANATMNPQSMGSTGGGWPHDNMLPYQAINYIISLFGIYPSPT